MRKMSRISTVVLLALALCLPGAVGFTEGTVETEFWLHAQDAQAELRDACRRFFKAARGTIQTEAYEEEFGVTRDEHPSLNPPDSVQPRTGNRYRWTTATGAIERTYTAYTDLDGRIYRLTYEGPSFAAISSWPLDDVETTRAFVRDWLKEVGWQQAQIVEIITYPVQERDGPWGWQGHEVLVWFPGGIEARVKVHTGAGEVRSIMWSEQAPSGQMTRADEAAWYEQQARDAVSEYLREELPEEMNVSINTDSQFCIDSRIPVWAWKTIELVPKDGSDWLYRVELNGDGVRRVQRAYTGAQLKGDVYSAQDEMLSAWNAHWVKTDPAWVRELENEISAYLEGLGIVREPWDGTYGVSGMLTFHMGIIAGKDTDYYLVYSYAKPGGRLYRAGEYIQVGYSLYQNQIAFLDLCADGNG